MYWAPMLVYFCTFEKNTWVLGKNIHFLNLMMRMKETEAKTTEA